VRISQYKSSRIAMQSTKSPMIPTYL